MQVDLPSCSCDKIICAWGTTDDIYAANALLWIVRGSPRYISIYVQYVATISAQHEKKNIILLSEFHISVTYLHLFLTLWYQMHVQDNTQLQKSGK